MKKNDITVIAISAIIASVFSIILSQVLFGASSKNLTAEKVDAISADFNKPDPKTSTIFNSQAIDPTRLIKIGDTTNNNPF